MAKRNAADAAQTRVDILVKARELFAVQGYAGTSAREISAAAGVTIGAMFHHFDSKLHLFECVFEELELEMDRHAKAASNPALGLTVLETFLAGEDKWREIDARLGLRTVMSGTSALMAAGVIAEQPVKPIAILLMGAMNAAGFAISRGEAEIDGDALIDAFRLLLVGPREDA